MVTSFWSSFCPRSNQNRQTVKPVHPESVAGEFLKNKDGSGSFRPGDCRDARQQLRGGKTRSRGALSARATLLPALNRRGAERARIPRARAPPRQGRGSRASRRTACIPDCRTTPDRRFRSICRVRKGGPAAPSCSLDRRNVRAHGSLKLASEGDRGEALLQIWMESLEAAVRHWGLHKSTTTLPPSADEVVQILLPRGTGKQDLVFDVTLAIREDIRQEDRGPGRAAPLELQARPSVDLAVFLCSLWYGFTDLLCRFPWTG
jgi:hypothetical protein